MSEHRELWLSHRSAIEAAPFAWPLAEAGELTCVKQGANMDAERRYARLSY